MDRGAGAVVPKLEGTPVPDLVTTIAAAITLCGGRPLSPLVSTARHLATAWRRCGAVVAMVWSLRIVEAGQFELRVEGPSLLVRVVRIPRPGSAAQDRPE
jgi:hypothetical protein